MKKEKCPFHYKGKPAYCMFGDCVVDEDKKCKIYQKHKKIMKKKAII